MTLPFPDALVEKLRAVSPRIHLQVISAKSVEDISLDVWTTVEVLYTNRIVPEANVAPNLRWIQFHWAGINHVADLPALHRPDLLATTLSGAAATQLAEYIVMMLLALGHRLHAMLSYQRRAEWPKDRWERFSPRELRDSTVGIVGYGSIGRQVARLLHPFGARVLATKRDAMHPEDQGYTLEGFGDPQGDFLHRLYPTEALRSMLKECDFVVVTVPLTAATRNLIDSDALAAMKPSAVLVDISRGGVVDHNALISALRDRKIGGAALDVFPEEPLPAESPLWNMPNVVITPHISGNTPHYDERATDLFEENLKRYISGLPLYNLFNPQAGY